jgi:hypothetical protein
MDPAPWGKSVVERSKFRKGNVYLFKRITVKNFMIVTKMCYVITEAYRLCFYSYYRALFRRVRIRDNLL